MNSCSPASRPFSPLPLKPKSALALARISVGFADRERWFLSIRQCGLDETAAQPQKRTLGYLDTLLEFFLRRIRKTAFPAARARFPEPGNFKLRNKHGISGLVLVLALACLGGSVPGIAADRTSSRAAKKPSTAAEILAAAQPSDWRPLDPENTLYLDLAAGRVIIELAPAFAPQHVANVKALARERYYDSLAIVRLQDNYVVQWMDPNAEKPGAARPIRHAQRTLPPEFDRALDRKLPFLPMPDGDIYAPEAGFSAEGFPVARDRRNGRMWLIHSYAMVGAGRDNSPESGGGPELYAVIGQAPRHLDRNVTLLGRVVVGIELLSSLPRGTGPMGFYEKPDQHVPIKSVRVAADVPPAERVNVEVMRTDTPTFRALLEARRHRREEWFQRAAGRIDISNVPIPTRVAKETGK
jgi:peptidylprolyl isomerase